MKNKIIPLVVVIALVIAIFYFIPKGGCKFDSECQEGYVCNTEGKCVLPEIVDDRSRDNFCADNDYPDGMYDPDCPRYCPASFERTGSMTMCCYEDNKEEGDMGISVDCETKMPINLFPEVTFGIPEQRPSTVWYNKVGVLQAMISFVPKGPDKSFKYVDLGVGVTTSITTGAPAEGSNGYRIWLNSITIKSLTSGAVESVFQNSWNNCQVSGGTPCIGKSGYVDVPANKNTYPSPWAVQISKANIDSIPVDNYEMRMNYCGVALPESLGTPQICHDLVYNIDIGESELDFQVSVNPSY